MRRAVGLISASWLCAALLALPAHGEPAQPIFDLVKQRARDLAAAAYQPPAADRVPPPLRELDYARYRDIRFVKEQALWKDHGLFHIEFFHPGFVYRDPVTIHEIVEGTPRRVPYDAALFDFGDNEQLHELGDPELGFAGFRVHYPLHMPRYPDELLVFQGASYFRMIGRGHTYGLSARGLAIDTALPKGEEFPRFTEFWLERPAPEATTLVLYALLDSPSVSGAYRFELHPRGATLLRVQSRLFARTDVAKPGLAPLTSMFLYGANRVRHYDDFRPQVHDSDTLLVHNGHGEWIARPLDNPTRLQISTFVDEGPRGFGLMQRERSFLQYMDLEARYDRRPSFWVTPRGDWGKGAVQLIEIPTPDETNDNIVAFWVPDEPLRAGQQLAVDYDLQAVDSAPTPADLGQVVRTRIGGSAIPGTTDSPPRAVRRFIVEFAGGELDDLDRAQPLQAQLSASSGAISDVDVRRLPHPHGWRVAFKLAPRKRDPADMRLYLALRGRRVSETWNYVWDPDDLE